MSKYVSDDGRQVWNGTAWVPTDLGGPRRRVSLGLGDFVGIAIAVAAGVLGALYIALWVAASQLKSIGH